MSVFWHWGQLGDINYSLPTVRALGGGDFVTSIRGERFAFIAPLLRAQPYIGNVRCDQHGRMDLWEYQPPGTTHDLNAFRLHTWLHDIARTHLVVSHARPHGVTVDPAVPWLVPDPSWGPMGCEPGLIVARSFRYRHPQGREAWRALLAEHPRAWFVGLREEADDLGVRHLPVSDAWDLARCVWRSGRFAGNQSFPLSVAVGLGVPHWIETEPGCTNSVLEGCEWQTVLI
jgi:hypothetical protein